MPVIRQADEADCYVMAPNILSEDITEILAAGFSSGLDILLESFELSSHSYTLENNDVPIAMFGFTPIEKWSNSTLRAGTFWMICTNAINEHWHWLQQNSSNMIELGASNFNILWSIVDVRKQTHIHWLKQCGFEFGPVRSLGKDGEKFQEVRKICAQ